VDDPPQRTTKGRIGDRTAQVRERRSMRRYGAMTTRGRATHVRPRPPSSGRPRQSGRVAAPSVTRVRVHRGIDARRRRLPLPARALLTLSVVILGAAVFLTAGGGIGPLVGSLGNSFGDAFAKLVATPNPSPSEAVATDSPIIAAPGQPYTNQPTATLHITVPVAVVGTSATVRVYVALQGLALTPVSEVPVGSTTQVQATVDLTKGRNDFSATIVKDGVESAQAPLVTIILDQDPPKVTINSPKDGASVNTSTVTIIGTTQAGTDLLAHNTTNGTSVTGTADANGKFSLKLSIDQGANEIDIRATDPAGNQTTATLTVKQGSGNIHAAFTVQIPGLGPISNTVTTDAGGRASFTISLVGPMKTGNGLATVLVSYPGFGDTTDRVSLTFVK
jgi:hypothetical protein